MKRNYKSIFFAAIVLGFFTVSCSEDLDTNEPIPLEPIGGYTNSDDIQPDNLIVKMSFEDNLVDAKGNLTMGSADNITYTNGKVGKAYQGSSSGFATFSGVSSAVSGLSSITSSMWIKTTQHTGGAQCLFMLPKTTDFWGNIFVLIEGTDLTSMQLKVHLQKDVTPSIPWSGQWIDHAGDNRIPDMYNTWKHVVWTYDENTSKYNIYIDGTKLTLPDGMTNRLTNDVASGGVPLGALANSNVQGFILGGFQQHMGAPWGAPDGWMLPYTGQMDEFRMYKSALSDSEVRSLYLLEKEGR